MPFGSDYHDKRSWYYRSLAEGTCSLKGLENIFSNFFSLSGNRKPERLFLLAILKGAAMQKIQTKQWYENQEFWKAFAPDMFTQEKLGT